MDKETLAQVEKVLKGGRGFVLVGTVDKKDQVEGGIIANNVSKYMIASALAKGLGLSDFEFGMLMVKSGLSLDDKKLAKKKVAKKKVAKKAVKKVTKK